MKWPSHRKWAKWHLDPAGSGPRDRMFLGPWQLLTYHDGRWAVRYRNESVAYGTAASLRSGKVAAWRALVGAFLNKLVAGQVQSVR